MPGYRETKADHLARLDRAIQALTRSAESVQLGDGPYTDDERAALLALWETEVATRTEQLEAFAAETRDMALWALLAFNDDDTLARKEDECRSEGSVGDT